MKKAFILLTTMALAMAVQAVEIGKPAPDFSATDINGKTVKLCYYQGKIIVLESYNSDCPFCNNQYKTGALQELEKNMAAKGVVWLIVNSVNPNNPSHRTPDQARQEFADKKIIAAAWIDDSSGAVAHLYDMKTTPDMYVIDKNGVLVYQGAIDNKPDPMHDPRTARNYVSEAVDALLAGKLVEVSQTKPYGCGVKYAN
jgi:peroxiredoxin